MVSQPLTLTPRPPDNLPLTLKKPPMPGEKDPLLTLDQSFHLLKVLMIEIKVTIIHTQTWPMVY